MYSKRETATILAALVYWREEEVVPHGRAIMRPYLKAVGLPRVRPLSADEIIKLSARLRASMPK